MAQAAKAAVKPDTPPTAAPPAKRTGKLLLIITLVIVIVFLLAAVGVMALLVLKKNGNTSHDSTAEPLPPPPPPVVQTVTLVDISKPPIFATLEPFTVNLRSDDSDDSRYLQAVIALRVADQKTGDALKGWMPEIRHRINLLLSSKLPSEVRTIENREALANEIQTQINIMLGVPAPLPGSPFQMPPGPIQGVLFNSFIVQ